MLPLSWKVPHCTDSAFFWAAPAWFMITLQTTTETLKIFRKPLIQPSAHSYTFKETSYFGHPAESEFRNWVSKPYNHIVHHSVPIQAHPHSAISQLRALYTLSGSRRRSHSHLSSPGLSREVAAEGKTLPMDSCHREKTKHREVIFAEYSGL